MNLRDALGSIYQDTDFADLFHKRGRAAEAPWRLALVTVLQALEHLSDRQATEMMRGRLDWKYALSLPLDDQALTPAFCRTFGSAGSSMGRRIACWTPFCGGAANTDGGAD